MPTSLTKAFIYAAGFGTRLRPYTLHTPKPMLEVFGRPMIEYVLCYLRAVGVEHATVNAAWLAEAFASLPDRAAALGLDLALSVQAEPYEHGGDLATATAFLDSLGEDEVFLALNGDTLFWLDPAFLKEAVAEVSRSAPLLILGRETEANPLHLRDGHLVGIGSHQYRAEEPDQHFDDFGVKLMHGSIRRFLPAPQTTMSLHGDGGLIDRILADGGRVLVRPIAEASRVEIGTVDDYEGRENNDALRALARRLCG
ncbi:MAG: NTP transferase domain-containing protein [Rhodothermaceae bacterium]|nr:NTP transferase domain-containing protein [Rhodothermaceae bacterium]